MSERARALEQALRELTAMVRGECPSLLNEDSGGNGELSCEIDALLASAPPQEPTMLVQLTADDVEWVVNDNAELGVKIGQQFFFCYKGHSLVYDTGAHDDGTPMMWRPVFKREFGECVRPVNYANPSRIGTVSLADSDQWKPLSAPIPPQEPTGASPQAETSEDEDDVPAVDSWSAPLRKPVVPKILSTDDFYALLRILEVLPVADPFLTGLQAKLSDEGRRQHGNRASHLSGPEFVREIERIEALIQSRQLAPVSPVEPETPTTCRCLDCEPLTNPGPKPSEDDINRLEKAAWDSKTDRVLVWYRDRAEMFRQRLRETERAWQIDRKKPTVEPEPCVWRDIATAPKDGTTVLLFHKGAMEPDYVTVAEYVTFETSENHYRSGWCSAETGQYVDESGTLPVLWMPIPPVAGAPLKVEKP